MNLPCHRSTVVWQWDTSFRVYNTFSNPVMNLWDSTYNLIWGWGWKSKFEPLSVRQAEPLASRPHKDRPWLCRWVSVTGSNIHSWVRMRLNISHLDLWAESQPCLDGPAVSKQSMAVWLTEGGTSVFKSIASVQPAYVIPLNATSAWVSCLDIHCVFLSEQS